MNLNLRNMRKDHRLTQEKLASMIGATKRQIGAWERGENDLPMDYAVLIADVFGCSLDSLIEQSTNHANKLTTDELELLKKYRSLSPRGKSILKDVLDGLVLSHPKNNPVSEHQASAS